MEKVIILGLVLALGTVCWLLLRKKSFSEQEKAFISFVKEEALRNKIEKGFLREFLRNHFDELKFQYLSGRDTYLLINDIPALLDEIYKTYA